MSTVDTGQQSCSQVLEVQDWRSAPKNHVGKLHGETVGEEEVNVIITFWDLLNAHIVKSVEKEREFGNCHSSKR